MTDNAPSSADNESAYEYSMASDEAASTAVTLFVSDVAETPIEDLPSLSSIVDTEHLNGLWASFPDDNGQVSFTYHDYEVTLRSDHTVVLRPVEK